MLRVGIIGCGRIAGGFEYLPGRIFPSTHAGAYTENLNTKLVAASDNNRKNLEKFVQTWEIESHYDNHNEMLSNEKLDLVSICTHDDSHFEIIKDSIDKGVKNIFCEKPLARNSQQILDLIKYCKKYQTNLFVNHTRRWHDRYVYVKKVIKQKRLGSMISITGRYTSGIRVIGSHMIDILRFFSGEIIYVKGMVEPSVSNEKLDYSENFDSNDKSYSAIMKFQNGVIGFLDGTSKKKYLIFEIEMQFEKGKLVLSNNGEKLDIWEKNSNKLFKIKNKKLKIRPMMQ
ncbi:Gfo/Idh/MocA family oxidoreductase, partial [Alphaproteobacteria bacterium]|nr:Gfo/Idh/MocA family oxidoreductase [Alphaproteobacteria bacterium]